jgi:hypothetical protein
MSDKLLVNTYRRSGTVFLSTHLSSALNVVVEAHHHPISTDIPTVSMVRDPIESITSSVILDLYGRNAQDFKYIADYEIHKYEFFTEHLLKTQRVIFDFKDINKIDNIIEHVATTFDIEYRQNRLTPILERSESHLLSSKDHSLYKDVHSFIRNSNLEKCYESYNKAMLLKSIL